MGRWTQAETAYLVWNWGARLPRDVAKHLGRSIDACKQKHARETGTASFARGTHSQRSLADATGYDRRDIRRATEALGLRVFPRKQGARWRIDPLQSGKIIDWLREEGQTPKLIGRTLLEVTAETGLHRVTILRRAKKLGIDVKKGNRLGQLLSAEIAQILAYGSKWGPGRDACKACKSAARRHKARGLCALCYTRFWKASRRRDNGGESTRSDP